MDHYESAMSFGEDTAADYDDISVRGDEDEAVAFLGELAGDGPALELAIGTGRIALPLAATRRPRRRHRPLAGDGRQLRAKPGGDEIVGDDR